MFGSYGGTFVLKPKDCPTPAQLSEEGQSIGIIPFAQ